MKVWINGCLFMCVFIASNSFAIDGCDLSQAKRGYWFYQECRNEEQQEDPYALPPLPPHAELMKQHPKELREILEERLEYAIYKMTPESVIDYYTVIDATRRKSLAFTALTEYVMLQNPELNAKLQNPVTVPARKVSTLNRNNEYQSYISQYQKDYALVMFASETCAYCRVQEATLKHFEAKYGWRYKLVDVDLNPGIAANFNSSTTPTTVIIKKGTKEWLPVSVGAESMSEVEVGVYRALRMMNKEITPTQFILDRYRQGGFFDPNSSEGI
jgi:conjugal transfer pilus assembly protein TraF